MSSDHHDGPHNDRLSRRTAIGAIAGTALAAIITTRAAAATQAAPVRWSTKVTTSSIGAYSVGKPDAKVRLVEYFSYTCGVCGDFARASSAALKTQYIDRSLVIFEYRNLVRDPLDMAAALLARIAGEKSFVANHDAIFAAQKTWLAKGAAVPAARQKTWYDGAMGERTTRAATDSGLMALMRQRGYTAAAINAALSSEVALAELTGMTNIGTNADHVKGTPTFFINGRNPGVTDWAQVKTRLDLAINAA